MTESSGIFLCGGEMQVSGDIGERGLCFQNSSVIMTEGNDSAGNDTKGNYTADMRMDYAECKKRLKTADSFRRVRNGLQKSRRTGNEIY